MNVELVHNIERQLKHLESDAFAGDLTTETVVDYVNQMRALTTQLIYEAEQDSVMPSSPF